jgi:hypothetical protein
MAADVAFSLHLSRSSHVFALHQPLATTATTNITACAVFAVDCSSELGWEQVPWPRHALPLGALAHRHTPPRLASLALPPCDHRNSDSAGSGTAPTGFWQRLSCSLKWCVSVVGCGCASVRRRSRTREGARLVECIPCGHVAICVNRFAGDHFTAVRAPPAWNRRTPTRHLRVTLLIVRSGAIGSLACFMDKDA